MCLFILFGLAAGPAVAQGSATETPFHLPAPEGWTTETLSFPLDFAPELGYEGLEDLRFSPGMFRETKADFWSYAFVWWVPESTQFDVDRLQADLETYFRGLAEGVAKARDFDPGEPEYDVQLESVQPPDPNHVQWQGTVRIFDAFTTRKPIRLQVRIDLVPCSPQGHVAALFQFSPQPRRHNIWQIMDSIRQGFRCQR